VKNAFSTEERTPEMHDFINQVQAGQQPTAPPCNPTLERAHIPLAPKFEALARRSAPGSATSEALTYTWRR
jgi:hypothetical protein